MTRRRRIVRFLDRLGWLCFQRPPLDYDGLEAYLDRMAGLDAQVFRIVRQTPSLRLEVVCPRGDHLWPTPTQLAGWTACPLCLMFTGKD